MNETDTPRWGTVEPNGWTTWTALLPHLDGATCAWAGIDGFHVGPARATSPTTTHLWAWRPGWWLRARVDVDRVVAGILRLDADHSHHHAEPVFVRTTLTWRPGEDRVAELPHHVLDRGWILLEVAGQRPVTFVGDTASVT